MISRLACSLIDVEGEVRFLPGSRLEQAYGSSVAREEYRCSFGLNPDAEARILSAELRSTARDDHGAVRGVELDDHPFFVATLFQPERSALRGETPPLAVAFIRAMLVRSTS